jgi:hypothetical protein
MVLFLPLPVTKLEKTLRKTLSKPALRWYIPLAPHGRTAIGDKPSQEASETDSGTRRRQPTSFHLW